MVPLRPSKAIVCRGLPSVKKPRIPPVDEKQVLSLLKEYDCPVPYHEVRTRFLGNIATPAITASPMHIVKGLWGGELPEFENMDAVNDLARLIHTGPESGLADVA